MMQTDIYEENAGLRQLKIHDPTIHDATMHDSCINYIFFFSCHEKTWVRETAYCTSGILLDNSKSDLISSLQSKKLIKLHVISFQQSTSYFTARGVLFVQKIHLCNSRSYIISIICTCDVRLYLHFFEHQGLIFENVLKGYRN